MDERKAIGKTKVGLIICASLVVILAVSNGWLLTRIVSLQDQVRDLQADKSGLQAEVISLQGEFEELSSEFEVLSSSYVNLTETYTAILNNFSRLTENYEALSTDFNELSQTYTKLLDNYDGLLNNYDILSVNYSTLLDVHQTLQDKYFALNTLYQQLQTQYETLLELWNEPLEYVVTPTWDEVKAWLETDQTDAITYDSAKFLCGDFSIMLIQHAKRMHWRMLFSVIEFDLRDDNPAGIERHHGDYGHAFVSIFTTEGIVYIEPQTDFTWYLFDPADPGTHVEFPEWEFVYFGVDWFGDIFVQYYNRMATDVDSIENISTSIEVRVLHAATNNDNPLA